LFLRFAHGQRLQRSSPNSTAADLRNSYSPIVYFERAITSNRGAQDIRSTHSDIPRRGSNNDVAQLIVGEYPQLDLHTISKNRGVIKIGIIKQE
jgi:hypothetical protein